MINADIIFLQETYLSTENDFKILKNLWGAPVYFSPSLSNHSGGVATLLSNRLSPIVSQVKKDSTGRCISLCYSFNGNRLRLCNIHAPNNPTERKKFIENLYMHTAGSNPIILGGDFNLVMDSIDSSSTSHYSTTFVGSDELNRVISTHSLIDSYRNIHPNSPGHTWSQSNKSSRIDRIYLPVDFEISKAITSPFPYSDHNPVFITFSVQSTKIDNGRGYWKYNCALNENQSFCNDLRVQYQRWSSLKEGFNSLTDWWDNVKKRIKSLAIYHSSKVARENRSRLNNLQLRCLSDDSNEIETLINKECKGAYIRSRVKYLEEGEKPSTFFFRQEKFRGSQKTIHSIRNKEGVSCNQKNDILAVFHEFYSDLYCKPSSLVEESQDVFLNSLSSPLNEDEKVSLEHPVSLNELWSVISKASRNKSPGYDGLPYEFYHHFFGLIGNDLLRVFNEIFCTGRMSRSQRMGIITLIPKGGDKEDPANWRPITLLNSDYKILSKVLQVRLAKILPSVINEFQSCGVPGRSIHSNLYVVRDIIKWCQLKRSSCALVSIDQQKAFDKVNWEFLHSVLNKLNFGENFVKWVTILYNDICSRVLINGHLSDEVYMSRGVRQGCPLSPLLYVLYVEPIARHINRSECLRGFSIPGCKGRSVRLLQYADDATCVATCDSDVHHFLRIFDLFQNATGGNINLNKSQGFVMGNVFRDLPSNVPWSKHSIKITGVVFGNDEAIRSNWDLKLEKAAKQVNCLTNRHLTLLGKVLVINTFIYPLFYYVAPVFPFPDCLWHKITKIVYPFLWGSNKPALVSGNVLTLGKDKGGLGLDDFQSKMDALFVKPFLSLFSDPPPLYLSLSRFFMASKLRRVFPPIWSNTRPNLHSCHGIHLHACNLIFKLYSVDNKVWDNCKTTKSIVKCLADGRNVEVRTVVRNPSLPWDEIWRAVWDNTLDNKLIDFQWRVAHNVLFTGDRVARFGIGDGKCPRASCNAIESPKHLFWECPNAHHIVNWAQSMYHTLVNDNVTLSYEHFLYGFITRKAPKGVLKKLRFIFSVSKFMIWKYRCIHVFEGKHTPGHQIKMAITKEIKIRIQADHNRWPLSKFTKVWTLGRSFVTLNNKNLAFKF
ncbi:hypothetical protein HOLleu_22431 [Holothuria leucospilota]|uniref:Reverse transcriptase domain-containing protein n=1 Tax=Holothuria leucospilota TaxID=206669 RepID=A0A9Q1H7G5_HOLLE|nr:hypothetical protein HOLleu_22431 [Holothuria leucospilota]